MESLDLYDFRMSHTAAKTILMFSCPFGAALGHYDLWIEKIVKISTFALH